MYEAKIIDLRIEPGKKADDAQYLVHYKGWKSSWDDWVTHDRIRKFTEDNKQLAAQLVQARTRGPGSKGAKKGAKATGSEMSSARGSEERAAASSSFAGRGPRRGRDYELETVSPLFFYSSGEHVAILRAAIKLWSVVGFIQILN